MATETKTAERSGKSHNNPVILLLLLIAAGAGAFALLERNSAQAAVDANTKIKAIIHLENFTVNLSDPEEHGFLRVGIDLGLGSELKKGKELPIAPVRDAIIGVLSTQHSQELLTPEGKAKMKADLRKELQDRVPEMNIQEIYFTEFLVQR